MLRRALIVAISMAAAVGAAGALRPSQLVSIQHPLSLEQAVPKRFKQWHIDDRTVPIQPSPEVQAELDMIYNQVLTRTYVDDAGRQVMLSIAYGGNQSDNLQVHFPEGCYGGQGFAVGPKTVGDLTTPLGNLTVARLVATKDSRVEPITYWLVVAGHTAATSWESKKAKLAYTLRGKIPDGILIRVSSISADVDGAYRLQQDFIAAMLTSMPTELAARFVGTSR
jgi:EpsI family protein